MHFGRVIDDKNLDLSLPEEAARTSRYLELAHRGRGLIYCGAPIWGCREWEDLVYPQGARPSQYLRYYARRYSTIELNSTFYSTPSEEQVRAWCREVGPEFLFCPKVLKDVSHELEKGQWRQPLLRHLEAVTAFEDHLGLSFLQLPEWFDVSRFPALEAFAEFWPKDLPLAIEFRHASWFQGAALKDPLVNFLYRRGFATVITDTPGAREVLHSSLTAETVLVRFQGVFPSRQDDARLKQWAERLSSWAARGMDRIFLAIHQPKNAVIPLTVDAALRYIYAHKGGSLIQPAVEPSLGRSEAEAED